MNIIKRFAEAVRDTASLNGSLDRENVNSRIRGNIYFKGPNAWILAFSVVIASVGLNINSVPVIIGAMLISPLMGPIFGIGFSLGTNDMKLMTTSLKNLVVMMVIALLASTIYFLITPLTLSNPTELLARTNPTIYDVLIAMFGGAAGMFEQCRQERGSTALSGVAIATALMPPLCTAGFGLASWNMHYFTGALYLFSINCVFIALAAYVMTKIFEFPEVVSKDLKRQKRTKWVMTVITLIFIIPSVTSATLLIRNNKFDSKVEAFMKENRYTSGAVIYDYTVSHDDGGKLELYIGGSAMDEDSQEAIITSAESFGIPGRQIVVHMNESELREHDIMKDIYSEARRSISEKDDRIRYLEAELSRYKGEAVPYIQITKEALNICPDITDIAIADGCSVCADSLALSSLVLARITTGKALSRKDQDKLSGWLKERLAADSLNVSIEFSISKQ